MAMAGGGIEVRGRAGEPLLRFAAPQSAREVREALQRRTGAQGVLQSAPQAYTDEDTLTAGVYLWHLQDGSSREDASWRRRVAAVLVALVAFGLVPQLVILCAALPFCDYSWYCAHGWYKAIISHIDGPFKVLTFFAAIRAAQAKPDLWLELLWIDRYFGGKNLPKTHSAEAEKGVEGKIVAKDNVGELSLAGEEPLAEKAQGGLERRKGFRQSEKKKS